MTTRTYFAFLPTPIHRLPTVSQAFSRSIWIKRDDQTGLAGGGNKARKLEFLLADAIRQKADRIITAGAAQSNHCRQTAAAARIAGLPVTLVLSGTPQHPGNGNLLLDQLLGADIVWTTSENRSDRMDELKQELQETGGNPYIIPIGGSNHIGTMGYIEAMKELMDQLSQDSIKIDHIVVASSSGGTQAGLVAGAKLYGFTGKIHGISIDKGDKPDESYIQKMTRIANEALAASGYTPMVADSDFILNREFWGNGYGIVSELEKNAISNVAKKEGILLDPVYTGRTWGAMEVLINRGYFPPDESILFWHTGGSQALYGYADVLVN